MRKTGGRSTFSKPNLGSHLPLSRGKYFILTQKRSLINIKFHANRISLIDTQRKHGDDIRDGPVPANADREGAGRAADDASITNTGLPALASDGSADVKHDGKEGRERIKSSEFKFEPNFEAEFRRNLQKAHQKQSPNEQPSRSHQSNASPRPPLSAGVAREEGGVEQTSRDNSPTSI